MSGWAKGLSLLAGLGGISVFGIKSIVDSSNSPKLGSSDKESNSLRKEATRELVKGAGELERKDVDSRYSLPLEGLPSEYSSKSTLAQLKEEAKNAFARINDYSFRLWSPCSLGTGWILDYQLPEEKDRYPTVWYIATNAHVVQYYKFGTNPYNQELPSSLSSTQALRARDSSITPIDKKYELNHWTSCEASDDNGYFDFSLSKGDTGEELKADQGLVSQGIIEEPRLFYVPINFLENTADLVQPEDNHRDFAVLEIEFTDEEYARKYTNDFAKKYDVETKNAINIFSKPLDSKYSTAWEMEASGTRFYTLAYPWEEENPRKFEYSKNFDEATGEGSTLSWDAYWLSGNKQLLGHVDTQKMERLFPDNRTAWSDSTKRLRGVGHLYILKNFAWAGGSSGSLYTDKDGNLLGIKRLYEKMNQHSFIVPLRSNRLVADGVVNSPEYDLIKGGVTGQKTSYKQQVERYIIPKNRRTWLSARGWEHKS